MVDLSSRRTVDDEMLILSAVCSMCLFLCLLSVLSRTLVSGSSAWIVLPKDIILSSF